MSRAKSGARKAFETFHDKPAGEPVHPLENAEDGEWAMDVVLPSMKPAGRATRVMYRSDKWHTPGSTVDYYHDHPAHGVRLWLPAPRGQRFPYKWPDAVAVLGVCTAWYHDPGNGAVQETKPKGCILVASPYGHVDATAPQRIFLAAVERRTGRVLALIDGPSLRLTAHGIEG